MSAEASAWQFRHHIAQTCHCMFETPQTLPSWDLLLAILCAWAPCTPTSLPCSRKWVNTLLIRNAEAKAWSAWMIARAASEPLVARTLIMKESRMRIGPFWFARLVHFNNAQSLSVTAIHQNPMKPSTEMGKQKRDHPIISYDHL